MAYDPWAEHRKYTRRVLTGLLDFSGRSRRSEVLAYFILMMLVQASLAIVKAFLWGFEPGWVGKYITLALWLPMISLFARRLHDLNLPGLIAVIVPVLLALKFYGIYLWEIGAVPMPGINPAMNIVEGVMVIAFWGLTLWPGTEGGNRYGPDPRYDIPVSAS